jgi:hypothetical protein
VTSVGMNVPLSKSTKYASPRTAATSVHSATGRSSTSASARAAATSAALFRNDVAIDSISLRRSDLRSARVALLLFNDNSVLNIKER